MLVIHNDLDFRCPIGQGHELFTALQRQRRAEQDDQLPRRGALGARSRRTAAYWHKEVFAWLEKYVEPGGK